MQINEIIAKERPQIIVHAAAERRPEECEKDAARTRRINVDATGMCLPRATTSLRTVSYARDLKRYLFDALLP
jgi:dTDP-4-dehydrorhamnose reductase